MINKAAIFAAALAVQTTAGVAQSDESLTQASVIFDGKRIEIGPNAADVVRHASRFAARRASCDPHCLAPAQAAVGIETVIEPQVVIVGYPLEKIRYYRGGMQVWSVLALTVQEG